MCCIMHEMVWLNYSARSIVVPVARFLDTFIPAWSTTRKPVFTSRLDGSDTKGNVVLEKAMAQSSAEESDHESNTRIGMELGKASLG